jgi:hypothetical protein
MAHSIVRGLALGGFSCGSRKGLKAKAWRRSSEPSTKNSSREGQGQNSDFRPRRAKFQRFTPDKEPQPHPSHAIKHPNARTLRNQIAFVASTAQLRPVNPSKHLPHLTIPVLQQPSVEKPSPRLNSRSSISIDRGLKPSYYPPLRPTTTTILSSRASA